jgi:enoyl-CoA hydratase
MLKVEDLVGGSEEMLVTADREGVRFLIINRPKVRNAMSYDFRRAYAEALMAVEKDDAVKVVVITGAAGHFSAGVDLKDNAANPGRPMFRPHPAEATRAMGKPVIAAIDGYCLTGGLELALSCSFIIATDRAIFADTHAKAGLFPGWGQSALLAGAIGARRARQMSFTGEMISAERAYEWGIVNELTAPEDLLPRCLALGAAIQACKEASVREQIKVYSRNDGAALDVALAAEEYAYRRWRMVHH